ncbi:MAG: heavy metal translocating P-type ATPase [Phycisphaerales bacterium]
MSTTQRIDLHQSAPSRSAVEPVRGDSAAAPASLWAAITTPRAELFAAMIAGGCLAAGFVLHRTAASHTAESVAAALYWTSLALGLFHGGRAAVASLAQRKFDIDVLMVIGAVLAAWLGAPAEGALLLFLFVLAGALEALAMARTTRAVEALHKLMPTAALRKRPGAADEWEHVPPESLAAGDRVKILPGEIVPADASVVLGESSINQSTLTGESVPRDVRSGDPLYAGTINVGNPIEAVISRPASESSLQRILNLVIEAQRQREPVQRLIDRLSEPYAWGVLGLSIAVVLVWWLALGEPLVHQTDAGLRGALYTGITLLIVASPCALIISTPTATLTGIARGARAGVLFKGGQALERLSRLAAIAFDKTGTLTVGRPRVRQIHPIGWSDESALLRVAAALERESTHPIAQAIVDAAAERNIQPAPIHAGKFTVGRGVSGMCEGKEARLGTLIFTEPLIPTCLRASVSQTLATVQHRGEIGTVVAWDQHAGVIVLADLVRPGAPELVSRLHDLGVRPVCMLTGDNRATAAHVASALGLDQWFAELLPPDKVAHVHRLKDAIAAEKRPRAGAVGVIGDGVNDAPALAAAGVSIAIGSIGSDAALESADIVLLSDDLGVVPWAVALARRVRRTILTNLTFSIGAMVIMALATLIGSRIGYDVPLWAGVIGHEGGTLLVVANSLLILLHPTPPRDATAAPAGS